MSINFPIIDPVSTYFGSILRIENSWSFDIISNEITLESLSIR